MGAPPDDPHGERGHDGHDADDSTSVFWASARSLLISLGTVQSTFAPAGQAPVAKVETIAGLTRT